MTQLLSASNEKSNKVVSPRDVWMRTHIYQEGHMLHAVTYLVAAQNPEIFKVSVDLRPIAAAVIAYHNRLESEYHGVAGDDCVGCDEEERRAIEGCVGCDEFGWDPMIGGFFSSIAKVVKTVTHPKEVLHLASDATSAVTHPLATVKKTAKVVKSIAKNQLLDKVAKTGKAIIKSKVTGAALIGLTTVFPAVGAPALGAYVAANAALAAVEKANALKRGIEKAVKTAKSDPKAPRAIVLKKVQANPKAQLKIKKIGKQAAAAKKFIATQRALASYSPDPVKKSEAKKAVHILSLVAQHRDKLKSMAKKSPKRGTTGLVIDGRGRITRGRYVKEAAKRGAELQILLSAKGKMLPGYFRKIGGCVGCF